MTNPGLLGDKTQLVALTLATRYNAKVVLWGIFWATLTVHIVSAGLGWIMGGLLPTDWIGFIAGLAFIGFGFWTLRGDSLDEEDCRNRKIVSPLLAGLRNLLSGRVGRQNYAQHRDPGRYQRLRSVGCFLVSAYV